MVFGRQARCHPGRPPREVGAARGPRLRCLPERPIMSALFGGVVVGDTHAQVDGGPLAGDAGEVAERFIGGARGRGPARSCGSQCALSYGRGFPASSGGIADGGRSRRTRWPHRWGWAGRRGCACARRLVRMALMFGVRKLPHAGHTAGGGFGVRAVASFPPSGWGTPSVCAVSPQGWAHSLW